MIFILISSELDFHKEIETVCSLFENGLNCFHLRKPKKTASEMKIFLKKIPKKYHRNIVLHSHHELIKDFRVKGLHLKKNNPIDKASFPEMTWSISIHSLKSLGEINYQLDYFFLSPIYDSISKEGYQSHFQDKKKLKTHIALHHQRCKSSKVIALGGVSDKNISVLKSIGFDGIASLGSIWKDADKVSKETILHRFLSLSTLCQ